MELFRDTAKFARSRPVIECAQCGERLFVPEWSEYVDARLRAPPVGMRGLRLRVRDHRPLRGGVK